jgi:hypothetical protein
MNPLRCVCSVLLPILLAAAQEPAPAPSALHGAWVSTGPDRERLEFRADGVLAVDGAELRWRAAGAELSLIAPGTTLRGTWRVADAELTIALQTPEGETRTQQYRRADGARATPATRGTAGRATFELPAGWSIARQDGDHALLNPGLRANDTLDALVAVLSGAVDGDANGQDAAALLRARLPELAAELASQEIEVDARPAAVRGVELPAGNGGAELRAAGRAAGRRVTVWVGATRDDANWAAVLVVVLAGAEERFLPGGRHVLQTLGFAAAAPAPAPADGADAGGLAGLEFGRSTFGSGSSLTTVYTFGEGGALRRRTMFSASVGGSDSTDAGTFAVRGDAVTLQVGDDATEARIERRDGQIVALRIGSARYERL